MKSLSDEERETVHRLATLASFYNWTSFDLQMLFGYDTDQLSRSDWSIEGMIRRAVEDGDDLEWIEDCVKQTPRRC